MSPAVGRYIPPRRMNSIPGLVEEAQVSPDPSQRIGRALRVQLVNAVLGNERIAREFGLLVTDLQTLHLMLLPDAPA
jgi:hypothetical protein